MKRRNLQYCARKAVNMSLKFSLFFINVCVSRDCETKFLDARNDCFGKAGQELMRKDVTSDSRSEQCTKCLQKMCVYKLLCNTDHKYSCLMSFEKHYTKAAISMFIN